MYLQISTKTKTTSFRVTIGTHFLENEKKIRKWRKWLYIRRAADREIYKLTIFLSKIVPHNIQMAFKLSVYKKNPICSEKETIRRVFAVTHHLTFVEKTVDRLYYEHWFYFISIAFATGY